MATKNVVRKAKIPLKDLQNVLDRYQARKHRDVSTEKALVTFSHPLQLWITAVRKGEEAILTFTTECPCARTLNNMTPW